MRLAARQLATAVVERAGGQRGDALLDEHDLTQHLGPQLGPERGELVGDPAARHAGNCGIAGGCEDVRHDAMLR